MRASNAGCVILGAVLLLAGCASGGMAPVVERSAAPANAKPAVASGTPSAGSEAADTDWTAKVRPLGSSGSTESRALPSDTPPPSAAPAPGPAMQVSPSNHAPASAATASPSGASGSASINPAVVSLLNTASAQSRAGDYPRAAATLERAIAIEPNNAWLWHRLAGTRLEEGRLQQAAELAAKSNSLASADRSLQAQNWKLIAEVRRRQGDSNGAAAAASQAARLSN